VLNVEGVVDVLGEAVDQPIGLRERGAPFESEGGEQLLVCPQDLMQGPEHLDVLFQRVGQPAAFRSSHLQGFSLAAC